jgi:hypothetical protein
LRWRCNRFDWTRAQSCFELPVSFAGNDYVVVGCLVRSSVRAVARTEKFEQCVCLAECNELTLAQLANQTLAAELRPSHEGAKRVLSSLPELEDVGCTVFR